MLDAQSTHKHLTWLIRLRWLAIVASLLAAAVLRDPSQGIASLLPAVGVALYVAIYNAFLTLSLRRRPLQPQGSVMLQIILDQTALSAVVYGTGGCHSPFVYFFLFHVVISGILLPNRYTIGITIAAAFFPAAVFGISHAAVLPRYDLFDHAPAQIGDRETILGHGAAFLCTLFLTAYFTGYLSRQLHSSRQALQCANRKLSALVDTSRPSASLSNLEDVLSKAFRTVLGDEYVDTRIIRLDETAPKIRCHAYYGATCSSCPAYHTDTLCWQLAGTRCRTSDSASAHFVPTSSARTYDEKVQGCLRCEYFAFAVSALSSATPVPGAPSFTDRDRLSASAVADALRQGQELLDRRSTAPPRISSAGMIFPLRLQDRISALLLFSSERDIACSSDTLEFIQMISELASSGLFSANLIGHLETSYLQTVIALANAVEAKDPYTRGHSERVAYYSIQIANALGLTVQEKEHITFGSILHDVGKIGITPDILAKPGRLFEAERSDIQSHPLIGSRILEPVHFLKPSIDIIRHHHENYDGSGYPCGLAGGNIPFKARIAKVADAWDAMMTDRPYRKAMSEEAAVDELTRNAGSQFDPEIVELFISSVVQKHLA